MDGFLTLIVLIILFNLFSAVLRAIKGGGGGAAAGRQKPVRAPEPESQVDLFFGAAEINRFDEPGLREFEYETEYEAESESGAVSDFRSSLYEPEAKLEPTPAQESGRTFIPEPVAVNIKTTGQADPSVPASGISRVLTNRYSFLAAFVLHEILDSPRALHRRGRP